MEIILNVEMDAPADVVWQIVGEEFGGISAWTSMLTASYLEGRLGAGAVRHCKFPPDMFSRDGRLRERLDQFDRARRELRYSAEDRPWFVAEAGSHWAVQPAGDSRCQVIVRGRIELTRWALPMAPLVRVMMKRMATRIIGELRKEVHARMTQA